MRCTFSSKWLTTTIDISVWARCRKMLSTHWSRLDGGSVCKVFTLTGGAIFAQMNADFKSARNHSLPSFGCRLWYAYGVVGSTPKTDLEQSYLPWQSRSILLGLRFVVAGSRVPLTQESGLFGILIPTTPGCSVIVASTEDRQDGTRFGQGQYLLFLEEVNVQSIFDCLAIYFRKQPANPTAQT